MCLRFYCAHGVFADWVCSVGGACMCLPSFCNACLTILLYAHFRLLSTEVRTSKPLALLSSSDILMTLQALLPTRLNPVAARNGQLIRIVPFLPRVSPRLVPSCFIDAVPTNLCCSHTFISPIRTDLPGRGNWTVSCCRHIHVLMRVEISTLVRPAHEKW